MLPKSVELAEYFNFFFCNMITRRPYFSTDSSYQIKIMNWLSILLESGNRRAISTKLSLEILFWMEWTLEIFDWNLNDVAV